MEKFAYPTVENIVENNVLAVNLIRAKKADRAEVLSRGRLEKIVVECQVVQGDAFEKVAFLLKALVRAHAFASGNRRTAFITAKEFLLQNGEKLKISDDPRFAKVMTGIREGSYSDDEIREWLEHGKIREFRR